VDPNEEFKRLADLSKWTNTRIAEELVLSVQYVGQILNDQSNVTESTVRHFQRALKDFFQEVMPQALHD
jgi:hypothetical protein